MCLQISSLQTDLTAARSRAEAAERQQQAAATASTLALSRAQQELEQAQSAQFVAEEAYKTADAAAKLLAQKVTGQQPTVRMSVGSLIRGERHGAQAAKRNP